MPYMKPSPGRRARPRRRAALTCGVVAVALAAAVIPAVAGAEPVRAESASIYLVQLAGEPAATYAGGVANIPGTRPTAGAKLDTKAWNYEAYRNHLRAQRAETMRKAGIAGSKQVAEYGVTFNGFAAKLTAGEVAKLRGTPGVVNVFKDQVYHSQTVTTPNFLGLTGPNGVWNRQFGGQEHAGEGMIIGVIDSGFWPENPSFAALPEPRPDEDAIAAKWFGECVQGDDPQPADNVTCNNKVIGARWYDSAGARNGGGEYASPRDRNGHGSHTASTAAGVPTDASVAGSPLGRISGMAPAARLAIYKVLWHTGSSASGTGANIVAAIDDAVSDGVDVINYSIGDNSDTFTAVELAFYTAAAAGIFVSAAAGNAGPGASTVDNAMPWQTTVAAGTHNVKYAKTITLGDGRSFEGVGLGPAVPSAPLIDSAVAAPEGGNATAATFCEPGSLDPGKVTGKIVLCTRGGPNNTARVAKSAAVKQAGGVGMILYNPTPNSLNAETHSVPTSHVGPTEGAAIKAYAASAGAAAALSAMAMKPQVAPGVTAFSSTGPSQSSGGDLLKPDILAPGVDVAAAVPPNTNPVNSFHDLKSGTSMAAPHVAGIAALIKAKNPTWTPSMIQSAMMTSAVQTDSAGRPIARPDLGITATPLEYGAGHVRPAGAFEPGLAYDSGPQEWSQYICGLGIDVILPGTGGSTCETTGPIDPSDHNYPSISIGDLAGKQTVTRTVRNTTNRASVYFARVQAPPGVSVKVTPSVLTVLPRRTATYTVEFTRTNAAFDQYTFGSLTWADLRGHVVRSPLAIQPVALSAPAFVNGTGTSGSRPLTVQPGYAGQLNATASGLVPATTQTVHLVGTNTTFNPAAPTTGPAAAKITVNTPAGTKAAQFATRGSDYPAGTDIDVFVYRNGALVGFSASGSSDEAVPLVGSGPFDVYVVQFALPAGVTEQDVKMYSQVVTNNAGNVSVTPASRTVALAQRVTFTLNWTGLTAGNQYFGLVEYSDGTTVRGVTLVNVTG